MSQPQSRESRFRRTTPTAAQAQQPVVLDSFRGIYDTASDPEAEFTKIFERFFDTTLIGQAAVSIVSLVLAIFTQIISNFQIAVYIYLGMISLYIVYLICSQMMPKTNTDKSQIGYKVIECILVILFLISVRKGTLENTFTFFIIVASVSLVMFLADTISSHIRNFSHLIKLISQVNMIILFSRFLIFVQGILIVIQLSLEAQMLWYIAFIPLWTLTLVLLFSIFSLFKIIFISYRTLFWSTSIRAKKRATFWTFTSLIITFALTLWGLVICSPELSNPSGSDSPFLGLLLAISVANLACCCYGRYIREDLLRVSQELTMIRNTEKKTLENMIAVIEERRKKDELKAGYLVKVSGNYFKSSNVHEIRRLQGEVATTEPNSPATDDTRLNTAESSRPKQVEGDTNCAICFSNVADAVLLGCGHGGICFKCGKELNKIYRVCHMCRQPIKSVVKISVKEKQKNFFKVIRTVQNSDVETDDLPL